MASPEEAISTVLSSAMDPSKILAWTNNETTGQLEIIYDGPEPVNSLNTTILVFNVHNLE